MYSNCIRNVCFISISEPCIKYSQNIHRIYRISSLSFIYKLRTRGINTLMNNMYYVLKLFTI